jgi:O-antigen/teichoic acid export membrane protein
MISFAQPYSRKQYLFGTGGNAFRQILLAVGVMFQTRIAIHWDPSGGGVWVPYISTWPLGMFFEIGISAVVARLLGWSGGQAVASGQHSDDLSTLVGAGRRLNALLAISAGLICAIAFGSYAFLVAHSSQPKLECALIGCSFGFVVALQMQGFFFQMALSGLGMPFEAVKIRVPVLLIAHSASILLAYKLHSVAAGYVIWPACSLVETLQMKRRVHQVFGGVRNAGLKESWRLLRQRVIEGASFSVSSGVSAISMASGNFLVGALLGSAMVPIYAAVVITGQGLQALVNQAITTYGSRITFLVGRHGAAKTRRELLVPFSLFAIAVLILQFVCIPFGLLIFPWMTGRPAASIPLAVFCVSAFSFASDSIGHFARVIDWSRGHWPYLKNFVLQLTVILALAPFVLPRFGLLGCIMTLGATILTIMTIPAMRSVFDPTAVSAPDTMAMPEQIEPFANV